jgi:hypothetical protein
LFAIGPNPVMCCFESPESIASGLKFCHRHIAALWLETNLGIQVQEVGHPDMTRFKAFERLGIPVGDCRFPPPNVLAAG